MFAKRNLSTHRYFSLLVIGLIALGLIGCDTISSKTTVTTQGSQTTSISTTTTAPEVLLDFPFAKPLNPSAAILARLATSESKRILFLSDTVLIYYVVTSAGINPTGKIVKIDAAGETEVATGGFDFYLGFDATHNVHYILDDGDVDHLGTVSNADAWKFYGTMTYANPSLFAFGSAVYDYFGNKLAVDTDNRTRVIYDYMMGEEIVYHTYNHKKVQNLTCTLSTYRLGEATPLQIQTLGDGLLCGDIKYVDGNDAVIEVFRGMTQVGYLSIDKQGALKTFYASDYLPVGATLLESSAFGKSMRGLYFRYRDSLTYDYAMVTDFGMTAVVSVIDQSRCKYVDADLSIVSTSTNRNDFFSDDVKVFEYQPLSGSMDVSFLRVNDTILILDVGYPSNQISLYDIATNEVVAILSDALSYYQSESLGKLVYASSVTQELHVYDLATESDTPLLLSGETKRIDETHFMVLSDDQVIIVDLETLTTTALELVSIYTRNPRFSYYTFGVLAKLGNRYYIIG
jgi:hypothetical protein